MTGFLHASQNGDVVAAARARGVTDVLHFTTNHGLLGIAASAAVLCRDELDEDKYLEHIYTPNCATRSRDAQWTGYINLSITEINGHMFGSSERWHPEDGLWWTILAFDVEILGHPDVQFVTTNNVYPCAERAPGVEGFEAVFKPSVEWGKYGSRKVRLGSTPNNVPTDPQAEVLYPGRISLDWLRAIYLREEEHTDYVASLSGIFTGMPDVPVLHKPEVFR
ncbi:DarT ssDNA thymidine ADP-ribosyltransferase family protein [Saccharothrix sp. BKS2]|uniref:DarT ssDNA thymidine ADP-ribosyltransferase family protein n=1 Tax=Saccharothrix sp. BKS2 TaxID=3064400 RepID=UPI0039ECF37E